MLNSRLYTIKCSLRNSFIKCQWMTQMFLLLALLFTAFENIYVIILENYQTTLFSSLYYDVFYYKEQIFLRLWIWIKDTFSKLFFRFQIHDTLVFIKLHPRIFACINRYHISNFRDQAPISFFCSAVHF